MLDNRRRGFYNKSGENGAAVFRGQFETILT